MAFGVVKQRLAFGVTAEHELAVMEEVMVGSAEEQGVLAGVLPAAAACDDMVHLDVAAPAAAGHAAAAAVAQYHRAAQARGYWAAALDHAAVGREMRSAVVPPQPLSSHRGLARSGSAHEAPAMTDEVRLITLSYSPWSERARWALDHHHIPYREVPHQPVLGELELRRIVGPRQGRYTVPVLLTGEEILTESWDIARYADRMGRAEPLIGETREKELRDFNERVDSAMAAGRALFTPRLLASGAAREETLPPQIPRPVRFLLRPMTWLGVRWFSSKYALGAYEPVRALEELRRLFDSIRARLAGGDYLLGSFSYADILAAVALQSVVPVADEYIRLGPASRRVWTDPVLAGDYADLVAWRDRLYARHRRE
jgi:glutathione S-transferase